MTMPMLVLILQSAFFSMRVVDAPRWTGWVMKSELLHFSSMQHLRSINGSSTTFT
jgi:hypothetical protein